MFSRRLKHLFNSTLSIKKMGELFRAAVAGDTVGVTEFLNKYPSAINKKDLLGRTALMQAAFGRHTDIIEILLKRGAAINEKDIHGNTAIIIAQQNQQPEVVALLEDEIEKRERQRMAEEEKRHKRWLEETDCSRGLKKPIRAARPLKPR